MEQFAMDTIEVQRRFDRASLPADASWSIPRMMIPSLTVDARVSVAIGRTKGFSLSVSPINLGFQVTHDAKNETFSRFQVTIEQTVLPLNTPIKKA